MRHAPPADRRSSSAVRGSSSPPPRLTPSPGRARNDAPSGSLRRQVDRTDLDRLDSLTALLLTLNDARASAPKVARHVAGLEVLTARVGDRFIQRKGLPLPRLVEQIALLGNRELEGILLTFLEDIVALHSESDVDPPTGVP